MSDKCWSLFLMLLFIQLTKLADIGWLWVFCPFLLFGGAAFAFALAVIGDVMGRFSK